MNTQSGSSRPWLWALLCQLDVPSYSQTAMSLLNPRCRKNCLLGCLSIQHIWQHMHAASMTSTAAEMTVVMASAWCCHCLMRWALLDVNGLHAQTVPARDADWCCRVKPETLQRKSAEKKAEAAARKGTRGAARQQDDPRKGPSRHPGQDPMEGKRGAPQRGRGKRPGSTGPPRGRGASSAGRSYGGRGGFGSGRGAGKDMDAGVMPLSCQLPLSC